MPRWLRWGPVSPADDHVARATRQQTLSELGSCRAEQVGSAASDLVAGSAWTAGGATTRSLVMRTRSGTVLNSYSEQALWNVGSYSAAVY